MVWNVAGTVGRSIVILGALAFTAPALAMGQGGGKPPKDDDPPTVPNPAIVYQKNVSDIKHSIAVVDLDGSNEIIFESSAETGYQTPTWSRDGYSILFAATCPQGWGIYRVSFDRDALDPPPSVVCADLELITTWPAPSNLNGSQPMESPDGSMIAYAGGGEANGSGVIGNDEIFIVHEDELGETLITNVTDSNPKSFFISEKWPSWSPDGKRLAVRQSFLNESENDFTRDVAVIRIDADLKEDSRVSLLDALRDWDSESALLDESVRDSIRRVMWSNTDWPTNLVVLNAAGDIWILEFTITTDSNNGQDIIEELTARNLTESTVEERRATWSPDDLELLYHAFGESGCGDGKRVTDEFVIVDSESGACTEEGVILSTKGRKHGVGYPHWWPNHQPSQ